MLFLRVVNIIHYLLSLYFIHPALRPPFFFSFFFVWQLAAKEAYLAAKAEIADDDRRRILAEFRTLIQEAATTAAQSATEKVAANTAANAAAATAAAVAAAESAVLAASAQDILVAKTAAASAAATELENDRARETEAVGGKGKRGVSNRHGLSATGAGPSAGVDKEEGR